jgi:arginine deiminase
MTTSDAPRWGADSETAPLREVLLCAPDHFVWTPEGNTVSKEVAADRAKAFDLGRAKREHADLAAALTCEGVAIRRLTPIKSQASQTFTRDSSFMTPWGAVICQMKADFRRGEYAAVIDCFQAHGVPIWKMVTDGSLEGGDVHVAKPGQLLVGFSGTRTTEAGALQVKEWFGTKGWSTRLIYFDPHFLHLDLLFCMVSDDTAILCTDVLAPEKVDEIVNFLAIKNVVRSTYRQAINLVGNVLSLGNRKVIIHKHGENAGIVKQLAALGFAAIEVDLTMFVLDGGGPHCLTMGLRRDMSAAPA